jgi:dTDP-4-amino-4,6-dideoxygalactose transaminase
VVADFERALAAYTGAPDVVTVDSCTNAVGLCLRWRARADGAPGQPIVSLPRRTYVGVPMQALHAGYRLAWRDEDWAGQYELQPWNVWDAAKRCTGGMYTRPGSLVCVSFHVGKILALGRGGAILTDEPAAAAWFRRMRHDGRTPGVGTEADVIREAGWHCALTPPEAALGLWRLGWLPTDNPDLPNEHTDVSRHPVFA